MALPNSVQEATEARVTYAQLQAIAAPSRLGLLRLLHHRRSTVTELSVASGLAKSSVYACLEILEAQSLVKRVEDERLWVYYELTPLGRAIAGANPLRLVVQFALAVASGLAGAALVLRDLLAQREPTWYIPPIGVPPEAPVPWWGRQTTWAMLLLALSIALAVAAWTRWRRARRDQFG